MYKIVIKTDTTGEEIDLVLLTEKRPRARAVYELLLENNLECEVLREVEPVAVKFKGL